MKLTIDFETRSTCDIRSRGAWVYSEDPTTEVLCIAYKMDTQEDSRLWHKGLHPFLSPEAGQLFAGVEIADTIEAHNMSFEVAVWMNVMAKRHGWPMLPLNKLRCSAAKAAMHNLPRSLEGACKALGLPIQKDVEGHRLMLKMCKPRQPLKRELEAGIEEGTILWHEKPEDLQRLYEYCLQDVVAEEGLSAALRDLPDSELAIWQLDMAINMRGIQADLKGCEDMIKMVGEHETKLLTQLAYLTNGAVKTAKQVAELKQFLLGLGCSLPDLTADTVAKELAKEDLNGTARAILEIRRSLGRNSASKYESIVQRASRDGRVRGSLLYHGAGTGRWSGSGIQPQNFASRIQLSDSPESILRAVQAGGLALYEALYADEPMAAAGATTRSVLVAAESKDLVVADYSAIEGRGLAWLAGEDWVLDAYRADKDLYVVAAASILHKPEASITKEERSKIGKVAELACGYQGGAGAIRKFGGGEGLSDEEIKESIVNPWRAARPKTVELWNGLENAALEAVRYPGVTQTFRYISFRMQNGFLMMRLPSGRFLYYYQPVIMEVKTPWGAAKDQVTYMTVNSITKQWNRTNSYGGKWSENATQALCRDLMAQAMLRLERAVYPVVLTVHDEIVSEVPENFGVVDEFISIMCEVPRWAAGFPVKAEGWRGKRYKK